MMVHDLPFAVGLLKNARAVDPALIVWTDAAVFSDRTGCAGEEWVQHSEKTGGRPMWLGILWWAFDDHLAEALGTPGLGSLPIWVPFLIGLAFSFTISAGSKSRS
jgi:hypothetical protein